MFPAGVDRCRAVVAPDRPTAYVFRFKAVEEVGALSGDAVIGAFGVEHVTRITGLSLRQLGHWDRIGFFRPSLVTTMTGKRPMRVYSFRDVVGLRVIAVLKNEHGVSTQQLRKAAAELTAYADMPWTTLRITVCKGEVGFIDPATGRGQGAFSGQYVMVPVIDQDWHVRRALDDLSRRDAAQIGAFERHRNVAHNARVFAGTRVPVRAVKRFLEAGYSTPEILREYPSLRAEEVESIASESSRQAAA